MNFCFKAAKITGGVLSFFWPQIFKNNWERQLQKHKKKTCEKFSDIAAFFTFNEFFQRNWHMEFKIVEVQKGFQRFKGSSQDPKDRKGPRRSKRS